MMLDFEKVALDFSTTGLLKIYGDIPAGTPQNRTKILALKELDLFELLQIIGQPQHTYQIKTDRYEVYGIFRYDFIILSEEAPNLSEQQFILLSEGDEGKIVPAREYEARPSFVGSIIGLFRYYRSPVDIKRSLLHHPESADIKLPDIKKYDLGNFLWQGSGDNILMRVKGDSMQEFGIYSNDIAVLNRTIEDYGGDITAADYGFGLTLKRLEYSITGQTRLLPANQKYQAQEIDIYNGEAQIFGVTTLLLRIYRNWT